jgi:hypothetical protein
VTDEQNAVLPGVTVTLASPAIIRPQSSVTNDCGAYMDGTYIGKLVGTYVFPHAVTFGTNFRYFTGQPVQKLITVRGLNQGTVSVRPEPVGATRLDNVALWDVRGSKMFRLNQGRQLEAMVDVFNLLNQNAKTIINTNAGPLFASPIAILPPLVARLGLRFVF